MRKPKRIINEETGELLDPKTSPDFYTLDAIRHVDVWTEENIRSEYARLRNIAQQRLREMSKSPIGRQSQTYKRNRERFKPISETTPGERKILLAEVSRMITARTGTLAGIKRQRKLAIATFQEHGYDFVTEQNYNEFGEFMRAWKASRYRGYGSTVAVDFFETAMRARNAEDFERAAVLSDMRDTVAKEFSRWVKQRNKDIKEGRKQNDKNVTSYELLNDWEDFLS